MRKNGRRYLTACGAFSIVHIVYFATMIIDYHVNLLKYQKERRTDE